MRNLYFLSKLLEIQELFLLRERTIFDFFFLVYVFFQSGSFFLLSESGRSCFELS